MKNYKIDDESTDRHTDGQTGPTYQVSSVETKNFETPKGLYIFGEGGGSVNCSLRQSPFSLEGSLEPSLNLLSLQILLHEISFVPPQSSGVTNGTSHLISAKMTNTNFVHLPCQHRNFSIYLFIFIYCDPKFCRFKISEKLKAR